MSDQNAINFVNANIFGETKLFLGQNIRQLANISSLMSEEVLSEKVKNDKVTYPNQTSYHQCAVHRNNLTSLL